VVPCGTQFAYIQLDFDGVYIQLSFLTVKAEPKAVTLKEPKLEPTNQAAKDKSLSDMDVSNSVDLRDKHMGLLISTSY